MGSKLAVCYRNANHETYCWPPKNYKKAQLDYSVFTEASDLSSLVWSYPAKRRHVIVHCFEPLYDADMVQRYSLKNIAEFNLLGRNRVLYSPCSEAQCSTAKSRTNSKLHNFVSLCVIYIYQGHWFGRTRRTCCLLSSISLNDNIRSISIIKIIAICLQ